MLQELEYREDFLRLLARVFYDLSQEWDKTDKTLRPALDEDQLKAWGSLEINIKKREVEPTLRLRLYTETGDGIKSDDREGLKWFLDGFIKKTESELEAVRELVNTLEGAGLVPKGMTPPACSEFETRLLLDEARCALRIVEAGRPSTSGLETYEGRA